MKTPQEVEASSKVKLVTGLQRLPGPPPPPPAVFLSREVVTASQKAHEDFPVRGVQVPPSGEGEVAGFLLRAFSFILRNSSVEGREIQLQGFSQQALTEAPFAGPPGGPGPRGS